MQVSQPRNQDSTPFIIIESVYSRYVVGIILRVTCLRLLRVHSLLYMSLTLAYGPINHTKQ